MRHARVISFSNLPSFPVDSENISIITTPSGFYDKLTHSIKNARRRILLSALYIGGSQTHLVSLIESSLETNPQLQVTILLDAIRGTRKSESSVDLLNNIIKRYPERCGVYFYRSPHWFGFLPERYREVIGLMHCKISIFDNDLLLTGANLNSEYFATRQDRYIYISKCDKLCEWYHGLLDRLCSLSFRVRAISEPPTKPDVDKQPLQSPKDSVQLVPGSVDPVKTPRKFRKIARKLISEYINNPQSDRDEHPGTSDTTVYPLVQIGPLGIREEERWLRGYLQDSETRNELWMTTGYFNISDEVRRGLVASQRPVNVLTASPIANGFYKSKGFSKFIPGLYRYLEERFYQQTQACKRITLSEYFRSSQDGKPWTYHAKGIWVFNRHSAMTVVGSSNFGLRSTGRDVEAQAIIVTRSQALRSALQNEVDALWKYSQKVNSKTFQDQYQMRSPLGWLLVRLCAKTKFLASMF